MNVYEMEGFLRGKCLPGDLKVNESNAEYLVRKLRAVSELQGEVTALVATLGKSREVSGCPEGIDLQDWVKQLAAENAELKDCVVKHYPAVEYWNSWADAEDKIQSALDTPATDRIVAGIKADGVEMAAKSDQFSTWVQQGLRSFAIGIRQGDDLSEQLREGADK